MWRQYGQIVEFCCYRWQEMNIPFHSGKKTIMWVVLLNFHKTKTFIKQKQSAGKVMATVLWDRNGILLFYFMCPGMTVFSDGYSDTLSKLKLTIHYCQRGRLSRGVLLLQDNIQLQVSCKIQDLLKQFGWTVMHPSHTPDLALPRFQN